MTMQNVFYSVMKQKFTDIEEKYVKITFVVDNLKHL
jgi:hypothetical protein